MLTARPATLADAALLLRWRNDPMTISASRVQAQVTAHDHVAWMERALVDPTRRLRIVTFARAPVTTPGITRVGPRGDLSIGTYRLDGVGSARIEISLTIAPEDRGRGLAREIIQLACREAVTWGPDALTAEIRRENIPSFVAFFRNGFMITGWRGGILILEVDAEEVIRRACPLCLAQTPHHTNATHSIGGPEGRHPRYDLHVSEGGGLAECAAGDLWLAWERARRQRDNGMVPRAADAPPKYNGGTLCDMDTGPCACGAWH